MGKSKVHRQGPRLGTYGDGLPTPVFRDVLRAAAYKVLTPIERLVLADMLRTYHSLTNWDRVPLESSFTYTWTQCGEKVSENAFYSAVKRIVAVGFFKAPIEVQEDRPAAPRRYIGSTEWKHYKPTLEEAEELARHQSSMEKRVNAKRKRRSEFREALAKATPKICDDMSHKEYDEGDKRKMVLSPKICDDIGPVLPPPHSQRMGRSLISILLSLETSPSFESMRNASAINLALNPPAKPLEHSALSGSINLLRVLFNEAGKRRARALAWKVLAPASTLA